MSKFIVTVFDDEKAAYEGSRAMLELDREGRIAVYAASVITRCVDGHVEVKEAADDGPAGTATGMLVGTMAGALGGAALAISGAAPAAIVGGMALGLTGGTFVGFINDVHNIGVDVEFLDDVGALLCPGKAAVVAEVTEGWTTPLDTRMEQLGGTVFRRYRMDVEDDQIERDIQASNRELDELEEEWNQATGELKEKLQAKVDAAKSKLQSLSERAEQKVQSLGQEAEAKLNKLRDQIESTEYDVKARFQETYEQMKSDYDERIAKLKTAGELTKAALTP